MAIRNQWGVFADQEDFTKFLSTVECKPAATPAATSDPLSNQIGGDHYKSLAIQPVAYIHANKIPFIEGSIIKYVTRWRNKGGLKDLEKAKHFIDLLIQLEASSTLPPAASTVPPI